MIPISKVRTYLWLSMACSISIDECIGSYTNYYFTHHTKKEIEPGGGVTCI